MTLSSEQASSAELVPVWRIFPEPLPGAGAMLLMRDGSFRMIIRAGALNFDMKGPEEKAAIIYGYGDLLSSLQPDFPLQIVCHTKRLNPEAYLRQYERRLASPDTPPLMRRLIEDHRGYFQNQVRAQNLLQREFYLVIPAGAVGDPAAERLIDSIPAAGMFRVLTSAAERKMKPKVPDQLDLEIARGQLDIRANHVLSGLGRLGIHCWRLDEADVVGLYYEMFHPGLAERQTARSSAPADFDPDLTAGGVRRRTMGGGF